MPAETVTGVIAVSRGHCTAWEKLCSTGFGVQDAGAVSAIHSGLLMAINSGDDGGVS